MKTSQYSKNNYTKPFTKTTFPINLPSLLPTPPASFKTNTNPKKKNPI